MHKKIIYNILIVLALLAIIFGFVIVSQKTSRVELTKKPIIVTSTTSTISPTNTPVPPRENHYYVSLDGNNANSGSLEQPWLTIQHGVDQALPGDSIYLRGGTYTESVKILISGQPDRRIVLTKYGQETVTIDGGKNPAITAEGKFWSITGLVLTSEADRTLKLYTSYWEVTDNKIFGAVYIWGNNNKLEGNEVDGSQHTGNENGIMDDGPNSYNNLFAGNKIHDFNLRGIWSQWFTHDNIIENNQIYNIKSETGICIDLDAATNVGYRHIVRGNVVHDCGQTGIELENSYSTLVENNLIYNTGLEGIQVISYKGCTTAPETDQYGDPGGDCRGDILDSVIQQNIIYNAGRVGGIVSYDSSGVKVYNNTIINTAVGLYLNKSAEYSHHWDVRGNIFADNKRAEISVLDPASISRDEYNLLYHTGENHVYEVRGNQTFFYSLEEWQNLFNLGQNSIEGNPLFVNPSANDFRLRPNSPAIDSGVFLGIFVDFDGNPRPSGPNYDLGAFEYIEVR